MIETFLAAMTLSSVSLLVWTGVNVFFAMRDMDESERRCNRSLIDDEERQP